MKIAREKLAAAATVAIYPIRFVQLGSIAIAGYAACYLVSMHHHHYCVWYRCSATQMEHISVPIGEVLFIAASVLVTLDWMIFGGLLAWKLHMGKPALVDTMTQFACACFALFVYSVGLVAFTSIPAVRPTWPYCYDMWNNDVYGAPEKYFCIVTQTAVTCGLITWIMTLLVALLNLVEFRKHNGVGLIRLGDDTRLPTEADAVSIQDVAVNRSL